MTNEGIDYQDRMREQLHNSDRVTVVNETTDMKRPFGLASKSFIVAPKEGLYTLAGLNDFYDSLADGFPLIHGLYLSEPFRFDDQILSMGNIAIQEPAIKSTEFSRIEYELLSPALVDHEDFEDGKMVGKEVSQGELTITRDTIVTIFPDEAIARAVKDHRLDYRNSYLSFKKMARFSDGFKEPTFRQRLFGKRSA